MSMLIRYEDEDEVDGVWRFSSHLLLPLNIDRVTLSTPIRSETDRRRGEMKHTGLGAVLIQLNEYVALALLSASCSSSMSLPGLFLKLFDSSVPQCTESH